MKKKELIKIPLLGGELNPGFLCVTDRDAHHYTTKELYLCLFPLQLLSTTMSLKLYFKSYSHTGSDVLYSRNYKCSPR